jgi:isochorismate synthase
MTFIIEQLQGYDLDSMRDVAARTGWLIEDPSVIRMGFGPTIEEISLPQGIDGLNESPEELLAQISKLDDTEASHVFAFASLPFDRQERSSLAIPTFCVTHVRGGETTIARRESMEAFNAYFQDVADAEQETQRPRSFAFAPAADEYAHNVAIAVDILRRNEISKVVLARSVEGLTPNDIDPASVLRKLRKREPKCTLYSLPLPGGQRFVGASPELLLRRQGSTLTCHPLAGTIAIPANADPKDYENWLLGSEKNLHEHRVLVEEITRNLEPLYDNVTPDQSPTIVTLRTVAHLGTWITATSSLDNPPSSLEALHALHPTAAVGGIPRSDAYELILRLERHDRGHYAGPVGWCTANGDGEWWVGIRGVVLSGNHFEAWAGAGIVSESDPMAEREETGDKLASVLSSVLSDYAVR